MSKKSNRFSPEVRERAVRMVRDHRGEYIPPAEAEANYYRQLAENTETPVSL